MVYKRAGSGSSRKSSYGGGSYANDYLTRLLDNKRQNTYDPTKYQATNEAIDRVKTYGERQAKVQRDDWYEKVKDNPSNDYGYGQPTQRPSQSLNDLARDLAKPSNTQAPSPNDWIAKMKKELESGAKNKPDLPDNIDLDAYKTEMATINDIANKYGFDYTREYAERQAEAVAQAKRAEVETARERSEFETTAAKQDLQQDFFQKYLERRQNLVDVGLNAGIASERNIRLDMNRQDALAEILANAQLYNQELDRDMQTIDAEALAYADKLYNERLQQGFANAMDVSQFRQSENHWQADMAMQQRNQQVDEAWRQFEWNNMSASEKARLVADAEQFGMNMAWQRHKFEAGMTFDAAMQTASNGGSIANVPPTSWQTTKGMPPESFKADLTEAIEKTGVPASWIQPMSQLIANESSWNPTAKNPNSTAHGYAQFLNQTRQDYEARYGIPYTTPVNQLILGIRYIQDRYGNAQNAVDFWNENHWY